MRNTAEQILEAAEAAYDVAKDARNKWEYRRAHREAFRALTWAFHRSEGAWGPEGRSVRRRARRLFARCVRGAWAASGTPIGPLANEAFECFAADDVALPFDGLMEYLHGLTQGPFVKGGLVVGRVTELVPYAGFALDVHGERVLVPSASMAYFGPASMGFAKGGGDGEAVEAWFQERGAGWVGKLMGASVSPGIGDTVGFAGGGTYAALASARGRVFYAQMFDRVFYPGAVFPGDGLWPVSGDTALAVRVSREEKSDFLFGGFVKGIQQSLGLMRLLVTARRDDLEGAARIMAEIKEWLNAVDPQEEAELIELINGLVRFAIPAGYDERSIRHVFTKVMAPHVTAVEFEIVDRLPSFVTAGKSMPPTSAAEERSAS